MKVLLVEDDPSSRLYLESLLEINNIDVKSAENGIEGLNVFDEFNPDIVITDIQMPMMNGLELLEILKKKKPETVVIITTAFGSERYAIQALQLGASNYLKKPVIGNDLIPILLKYKRILFEKPDKYVACGNLLEHYYKIEFDARIENIPRIIDRLLQEAGCFMPKDVKFSIELGLVELITNAIEHGCLEISYFQKQKALDEHKLDDIYKTRECDPKYKDLKITVEYKFDSKSSTWTISDNGKGFDWHHLPDPTSDENLEQLSGRGIFITRFIFDELTYFGRGNVVCARKFHTLEPESCEVRNA